MQGNVVTFTGNVVMTQGTIKINADKVVVTRPGGEQGKEIIDGYGNPATFYQMQDNGKPVKGHASHMHYELAKDLVILTGNAYLEQLDSNITGDQITYLVKEQKCRLPARKANASRPYWFRRSCRTKAKARPRHRRRVTNSLWQH